MTHRRPIDYLFSRPPLPKEYEAWVDTTRNCGAVAYSLDTPGRLLVLTYSPVSKFHVMDLDEELVANFVCWLDGLGLIQFRLPDLSADQREQLISGLTPEDFPKE